MPKFKFKLYGKVVYRSDDNDEESDAWSEFYQHWLDEKVTMESIKDEAKKP